MTLLEKIIDAIMRFFSFLTSKTKGTPVYRPPGSDKRYNRNRAALLRAAEELGVKEVVGNGNNAKVVRYHAYARKDNDPTKGLADSVPWCSSFVCFVLENCFGPDDGMQSTNSMQARSYLNWGLSSKKAPLPGDIVVFWRGAKDDWRGHVGFYLGETTSFIYVLGGNQSDAVTIARMSKSKFLDTRRSSKQPDLSEPEQDELWDIADDLISGKEIDTSGKVD